MAETPKFERTMQKGCEDVYGKQRQALRDVEAGKRSPEAQAYRAQRIAFTEKALAGLQVKMRAPDATASDKENYERHIKTMQGLKRQAENWQFPQGSTAPEMDRIAWQPQGGDFLRKLNEKLKGFPPVRQGASGRYEMAFTEDTAVSLNGKVLVGSNESKKTPTLYFDDTTLCIGLGASMRANTQEIIVYNKDGTIDRATIAKGPLGIKALIDESEKKQ